MTTSRMTRRTFIRSIGVAGLTMPAVMPTLVRGVSPNARVRHASFGGNGMAFADMSSFSRHPHWQLVAVCDLDEARFDKVAKQFPDARRYTDWRVLLEKEARNIDSVNVSTPDHMHAPIAMSAILAGKPVYCQKPLTKWVYEARKLTEAARKAGVPTQMGIQVHSSIAYRMTVQLIQEGAIGRVKRVHSFEAKSWGGTSGRPTQVDPVPAGFNWDHWLGVAPAREFTRAVYHPGQWRRWQDFGTGTFGDMGCHIYDPVFKALELTAPLTIQSTGETLTGEQWPNSAVVTYVFPATKYTTGPTVEVTWYDGGQRPPQEVQDLLGADAKMPRAGSIFIGEKGVLLIPHGGSAPVLLPKASYADFNYPKLDGDDHWAQFVDAVRGERKTTRASFDYSGPLSETILLGNVAQRFAGQTLEWDAPAMKIKNVGEANNFIRREYRKGWEVPGLS